MTPRTGSSSLSTCPWT